MRFNDNEYLHAYYKDGSFPHIHDDIYIASTQIKIGVAIDIGCCFGLLAARIANDCEKVIGIDISEAYLQKAVKHPKVEYLKLGVDKKSIDRLSYLLQSKRVDTVIARRVIPEIYETGGFELCNEFCDTLAKCGVKYIVLEGRKSNSKAVNPLKNADEEVKAMSRHYQLVGSYKNCRILKLR